MEENKHIEVLLAVANTKNQGEMLSDIEFLFGLKENEANSLMEQIGEENFTLVRIGGFSATHLIYRLYEKAKAPYSTMTVLKAYNPLAGSEFPIIEAQ